MRRIVLFACGEPTCPRVTDNTTTMVSRRVTGPLSDKPVCSTCKRPMGVYDIRNESESERGEEESQEETNLREEVFREEARIQARASDRIRRSTA